jgi:UDP-GlcNAc:undecaprenyl-phosphate GlcNAc-1-phosphate transferase
MKRRTQQIVQKFFYLGVIPFVASYLFSLTAGNFSDFAPSSGWVTALCDPQKRLMMIFAAVAFASLMIKLMIHINLADIPGHRSSHTVPTPRAGGLAIYVLMALSIIAVGNLDTGVAQYPHYVWIGFFWVVSVMAAMGLLDDWRRLSASIRGAAQIFCACIIVSQGVTFTKLQIPLVGIVELGAMAIPLTFLWIVFFTNAFNFMDGLNGLAGNVSLVACLFILGFAGIHHHYEASILALGLIAGLAAFLSFNFPNATIFLGDIGSQTLGISLSIVTVLVGESEPAFYSPFALPAILFPFIFDASFTLIYRLCQGKNIFKPHKEYLFHRLSRIYLSQTTTTLCYTGLSILYGACALWCMRVNLNVAYVIFYALVIKLPVAFWLIYADSQKSTRKG